MTTSNYTREEEERLLESLRARGRPVCPRCGGAISEQRVPHTEGVPYVRDRIWLTCQECRRSVVLDRRRFGDGV